MKDILEIILYIIAGLGGIAGIVLLIIMTLQVVVSAKEDLARDERREQRDKEYHEARMKELTSHRRYE